MNIRNMYSYFSGPRKLVGLSIVFLLIFVIFVFVYHQQHGPSESLYSTFPRSHVVQGDPGVPANLKEAVQLYASPARVIVLSSADKGYIQLAINLYLSSYKRFHINNHLFVASDKTTCGVLRSYGANCVEHGLYADSSISSTYFMKSFKTKCYLKTQAVLEVLMENISVMLVDLDIVFLKNPLEYIQEMNTGIVIQSDGELTNLNSGFYFIRASNTSRIMFEQIVTKMNGSAYDQPILNKVLEQFRNKGLINQTVLPLELFPNGQTYFDLGQRNIKVDNPCTECYIVHNNWIVSSAAKILRFKQHGLWFVDTDGYYSDASRKYLAYNKSMDFGQSKTKAKELSALKTAFIIGYILNRSVILPDCQGNNTKANSITDTKTCDLRSINFLQKINNHFGDATSHESIFLEHDSVPESIKKSNSAVYNLTYLMNTVHGKNTSTVATSQTILQLFGHEQNSVLWFDDLYYSIAETNLPTQISCKVT